MFNSFFQDLDVAFGGGGDGGSRVNRVNPTGPAIQEMYQRQAQERADKRKGFMESMLGSSNAERFARPDMAPMPQAPPPQWSYAQGQGPVWQTPERIGASTNFQMVNNTPGMPGFYGGGNRI